MYELCFVQGKLLKGVDLPKEEENFQKLYVKAPSFLSIHMGVKADVVPPGTDCHHFVLEVVYVFICCKFQQFHLTFPWNCYETVLLFSSLLLLL